MSRIMSINLTANFVDEIQHLVSRLNTNIKHQMELKKKQWTLFITVTSINCDNAQSHRLSRSNTFNRHLSLINLMIPLINYMLSFCCSRRIFVLCCQRSQSINPYYLRYSYFFILAEVSKPRDKCWPISVLSRMTCQYDVPSSFQDVHRVHCHKHPQQFWKEMRTCCLISQGKKYWNLAPTRPSSWANYFKIMRFFHQKLRYTPNFASKSESS